MADRNPKIDIIVPGKNEAENMPDLVGRIDRVMVNAGIPYSIIFVDDHSTDDTAPTAKALATKYPLVYHANRDRPGKAYAILAGLTVSHAPYVAMLDADLEYSPELLPEMLKLASVHGGVVANRIKTHPSFLRKLASRTNRFIFGKFLLGFDCDTQSGLKLFRREVFEHLDRSHVQAWSIDMPLLHTTLQLGYTIGKVDMEFTPRSRGISKLHSEIIRAVSQIGGSALKLRFAGQRTFHIAPDSDTSSVGAGVVHNRKRYVTHSLLPNSLSALTTTVPWQNFIIAFLLGCLTASFAISFHTTAVVFVAILTFIYFLDVLFNFFLVFKSLHFPPELNFDSGQLNEIDNDNLPVYSVLCPLYKEAHVLPAFVESISLLDWPKNKLEVLLLLEEDDTVTIQAAKEMDLPSYVKAVVVPHSFPKTKPKACNYGLAYAKGELIVIYDAEDRPEPDQLKKAYLGFKTSKNNVACLQAKLNYYNPHQNLLTRLFTAEYSLWFDVVLPGLQSVNTSIPLGGTSNHFKTHILRQLQGWDAFNVTEDCDLGARLFKSGYTTAIVDSTTLEEANSKWGNWFRQRSRWIKGYMQTYLVHNRNPLEFIKKQGIHAFIFQLVVGGKIAFMLINPLLWLATILYFSMYSVFGPAIESLYPSGVFYMAVISLVFGNFLSMYYYMIGVAKRGHWTVLKFVFLIPIYWLAVSMAALKALIQLVFKPHYWEKTTHGLHIPGIKVLSQIQVPVPAVPISLPSKKSHLLSGFLLIMAAGASNLLYFAYNVFLGRSLDPIDFGIISLLGSFTYIVNIPAGALMSTLTYRIGYLSGKLGGNAQEVWKHFRPRVIIVSLIMSGLWALASSFLSVYFKTDILAFLVFSPVWFGGITFAVDKGFLSGNLKFALLSGVTILEALTKLALAVLFVQLGLESYVVAVIPLSMIVPMIVSWIVSSRISESTELSHTERTYFPKAYFGSAILNSLSFVAFLSLDVILAKLFLSPVQAGQYALISLVGKMIFFAGSLFSQFITPVISRKEGAGENSKKAFLKIFYASAGTSLILLLSLFAVGNWFFPMMFGNSIVGVLYLIPLFGSGMVAYVMASTVVNYYQVRREYLFSITGLALAFLQIISIYFFHQSVEEVVLVMFALSILNLLVVVFLHVYLVPIKVLLHQIRDVVDLFLPLPKPKERNGQQLKILIFNWYDIKHVWAGGAELYIHQLAKNWVIQGHQVTMFAGNDWTNPRNETIDGIKIVRRGGQFTVAIWAFVYYFARLRSDYDIVIDIPKGVPFFTPLYIRKPIITHVHQVHQEMFRTELNFPLKQISMFLEGTLMPIVYRNTPLASLSQSAFKAIQEIGLAKRETVIVNPGVEIEKPQVSKTKHPTLIYLGRLRPYKSVDLVIMAVADLKVKYPNLELIIAGTGEDESRLKSIAKDLDVESSVNFVGRVSEEEKARLYAKSWISVQPSLVEGWGMTNIEANMCGTPVVAANTEGLRDSVVNNVTGLLFTPGDLDSLEEALERIISSSTLRSRLTKGGLEWGRKFDWESASFKYLEFIQNILSKRHNYKFNKAFILEGSYAKN